MTAGVAIVLGMVSVSQVFHRNFSYFIHILITVVYPGSSQLYLPGYPALQSLLLMHGVPGWMLYHEFDPGFWGSVSVSLLLLHNSSHTTADMFWSRFKFPLSFLTRRS
jgi:hypothetical protein